MAIKFFRTSSGDVAYDYEGLENKPTIPSKTSELENDSDFITDADIPTMISAFENDKNYQTADEVTAAIAAKIAEIIAEAPESFDTLKEIADWIESHADDAAAMNTAIKANADGITELNNTKAGKTTATTTENGLMSSTDKAKLDGIESGAEKNAQSDWSVTDSTSDAYIKNKPENLSDFTNDSNFVTATDLDDAIQHVTDLYAEELDGTKDTYNRVMRKWFLANGVNARTSAGITELCDKWYALTRDTWCGYTEFYLPDVSAVSTGTAGGDNADLTCAASTDTVAGQDDYAGLPLFACVDVNCEVDPDTLEPVITAIDGITDNFVRNDPEIYVGVMQMSGYVFTEDLTDTYVVGYSATDTVPYGTAQPLAESVKPSDNTMREWVVHVKYLSKTVSGKLTSCAGLIPTAYNISHNNLHTLSKANGAQYSGTCACDDMFLKIMLYIKYKSLTADGIIQGCCQCNYQHPALVSETGTKRIIVNSSNWEVGMSCLIGTYDSTKSSPLDRNTATVYSITGNTGALVTAVEDYVVDGTTYKAVYVDTEGTFDTVANGSATDGTTYITSFHWQSGTTDDVLGNDGSKGSNTSGKYPGKIQGIEFMVGFWEVFADTIYSLYQDSDGAYWYEPYTVNRTANQATSITANYKASGVKIEQPSAEGWSWIRRLGINIADGVMSPIDATGGSSSTYTRDSMYRNANATGNRAWCARGHLNTGTGNAGLSNVVGSIGLTYSWWASGGRLSVNGNRGEWQAAA